MFSALFSQIVVSREKVVLLCKILNINMDSLEEVKVNGNQLILTDIDEETKEITKEDIVNLICKNGCAEI